MMLFRLVITLLLATLAACGGGGGGNSGGTPPAPVLTLAAAPPTVASGSAATLTWSASDAEACTASGGWSGDKPLAGTQSTGALTASTTYTLACTGVGGSVTQSVTVTVNAPPPAPGLTLAVAPQSLGSGQSAILTWSSTGTTSCTAADAWSGSKATSGSQSTGPLTSNATYTLTCSGAGGSVSKTASVTVTPVAAPPVVNLAADPSSLVAGNASTLSWSTTNASGCTASGGWSGSKATSGTQGTGALTATKTYTLACTGAGGTANHSVTVIVVAGGTSPFPLHAEAGKRYLITAQGKPFLIQGDTPWLLMTQLNRADVDLYLEDRRQKGVNTILLELIEHYYSDDAPNNWYGAGPFLVSEDFSTPNESYFAQAEYVIAKAREKGMLVLMTPAYLGFEGGAQGWYQAMGLAGNTALRNYGQYIANRFKSYDNILWVHGGDYDPPDRTRMRAVVDGIRDIDTSSLHTFHGARGTAALQWLGSSETWLDVNTIYTTKDTVMAEAQGEYQRATMPFFLIEDAYENETANGTETRQQAWQAVLSGAMGQVRGEASIWRFSSTWKSSLNTEGASTMIHLRTLLESYAWWTLVPDFANDLLTAGIGSGAARAPAAMASDGGFAFVYTRDVRDLTVDMSRLAGLSVRARWYDPTNGTYTGIAGSPFPDTGSRVFRPIGNNSLNKTDWVLVLDTAP